MLDPYQTLEIGRNASAEEVKRAFRRLAKELHPDLNPNNPAMARRFRDIAAAYDLLSDDARRRDYDRQIEAAKAAAEARRDAGAFDDGLDSFFRSRARPQAARRERSGETLWHGADIQQSLRIGFVEAALGARKRLQIGAQRVLDVVIPAATQDGHVLRLKGQGAAGLLGGTQGDLLIEIAVEPHPVFTRKDHDIHMTLAVGVANAVQGGGATVPTIHGPVQLRIPKGSNTDTMLRLRGKGIPGPAGVGDQYVTLKVMLPAADDAEFARLVEQWARRRAYAGR